MAGDDANRIRTVIWAKTEAGRREIQPRALVKERARRNLLLVIDGVKSEASLLATLSGIGSDDFRSLEAQGLIAPVPASSRSAPGRSSRPMPFAARSEARPAASAAAAPAPFAAAGSGAGSTPAAASMAAQAGSLVAAGAAAPGRAPAMLGSGAIGLSDATSAVPLDVEPFAAALGRLISSQLGLRGFVLSLALEKASSVEDLQAIAQRALEQIRERKGDEAFAAARHTLYGA
jgi:hypothetical protein